MRHMLYQCGGCVRPQKDQPAVRYCKICHTEYRRIGSLVELIVQYAPRLRGVLRADLLTRMWLGYLRAVSADQTHIDAAERLLAAPRAGQNHDESYLQGELPW